MRPFLTAYGRYLSVLLPLLWASACHLDGADGADGVDVDHVVLDDTAPTPRFYRIASTGTAPVIDGVLDDRVWQATTRSTRFVDIIADSLPSPSLSTYFQMTWDNDYLYVAAHMEEPHVWATLTERNSIIYYDDDFEIFIDPDGDHHNYYEFEVNALNTVWELTLEKPYRDGGPAVHGTNLQGLMSAVFVDGTLNNPADVDRFWSVEVALPWSELKAYSPVETPPTVGACWKFNFSRVDWLMEITNSRYQKVEGEPERNWVWSPQGAIDMHRPEKWGWACFEHGTSEGDDDAAKDNTSDLRADPRQSLRDILIDLYYAQRAYHEQHTEYAASMTDLGDGDWSREEARITNLQLVGSGYRATATRVGPDGVEHSAHIDQHSRFWTD